ncbi:hypothetical protein LX81_01955 [Palleronia aestuarii]|uniref:Uncharacterized protein n=1 Tax=Palleronia aestuarii TaxID=568105 RepID=A0A2W7NIR3_9RHOB|nr:DUF2161 family putative PD-(D/E)XK-type phosphodiesterase [Palleronia aestuarii]PZX16584.1 hypothetical protein LX81_01955 [Palleronia aestuarii]
MRETDLYAPVKAFLEAQGYTVKGEIGGVDVMALRADEPPVMVELKRAFSLALVYQGIARQSVSDAVYLAVPEDGARTRRSRVGLCRRLGLGYVTVRLRDGHVTVHCDPGPFVPRRNGRRAGRLLREFARLEGDPNVGGGTRRGLVTAYRQDALSCARHLGVAGPSRGAEVARATGVAQATRLMADDHYGWFSRVARGVYDLTEAGRAAAGQGASL